MDQNKQNSDSAETEKRKAGIRRTVIVLVLVALGVYLVFVLNYAV